MRAKCIFLPLTVDIIGDDAREGNEVERGLLCAEVPASEPPPVPPHTEEMIEKALRAKRVVVDAQLGDESGAGGGEPKGQGCGKF